MMTRCSCLCSLCGIALLVSSQQSGSDIVEVRWWQNHRRLSNQPETALPEFMDVEFTSKGVKYHLSLERNHLVTASAKHVLDYGNGHKEYGPMPPSCFYLGNVVGQKSSGVGISTCDGGFNGLVLVGDMALSIELVDGRALSNEPHAPMNGGLHRVRTIEDEMFKDFVGDVAQFTSVRATNLTKGRFLSGASKKHVEVVVVNDNSRYLSFGGQSGLSALATQSTNVMNAVTTIYNTAPDGGATFPYQIQVVLVGMHTNIAADAWASDVNMIGGETDVSSLLNLFSAWGQTQQLAGVLPESDNRVLLSGLDFDGSTVGLAYVGTMCELSRSANVNMCTQSSNMANCAGVVAHEMGHNFDMTHDGSGVNSGCSSSGFIMEAVGDGIASTQFSGCSAANIQTWFNDAYVGNGNCLENMPTQVFGTPVCGNGFVEPGDSGTPVEECDCGQADCSSIDPCCDGATCMFAQPSYECSDLTGACCSSCMFVTAGANHVCRAQKNSCDIEEICAGGTADCPQDQVVYPGQACTISEGGDTYSGLCSAGRCMSLDHICTVETTRDFTGTFDLTDTCAAYNDDCGNLVCHDATIADEYSCAQNFATHGKQMSVPDGTPCWFPADPRGTRLGMCSGGRCAQKEVLAVVPLCGNGGIDYAEECDCGNGGDSCCDCATCTLKQTSSCSSKDACCDSGTCTIKTSGTVCRAAVSACDLAETCDGTSAICPPDIGKQWGTACTSSDSVESTCYGKMCLPSLDAQCALKDPAKPKGSRDQITGGFLASAGHDCERPVCCTSTSQSIGNFLCGANPGTPCTDPWSGSGCLWSTYTMTFTVNGVSSTIYIGAPAAGTSFSDLGQMCVDNAFITPPTTCTSGEYLEISVGLCMSCAVACVTCNGPTVFDCVTCAFGSKDARGACPVSADQVVFAATTTVTTTTVTTTVATTTVATTVATTTVATTVATTTVATTVATTTVATTVATTTVATTVATTTVATTVPTTTVAATVATTIVATTAAANTAATTSAATTSTTAATIATTNPAASTTAADATTAATVIGTVVASTMAASTTTVSLTASPAASTTAAGSIIESTTASPDATTISSSSQSILSTTNPDATTSAASTITESATASPATATSSSSSLSDTSTATSSSFVDTSTSSTTSDGTDSTSSSVSTTALATTPVTSDSQTTSLLSTSLTQAQETVVEGEIQMDCSDSFDVNHPENRAAIIQALAELLGVPAWFINIILTFLGFGGRRLEGDAVSSSDRRLAAAIKVDYTVTIPSDSTHTGASVSNTMESATTSQVAAVVQTKMTEVLGQDFTVSVTNKSSPSVTTRFVTQTTSLALTQSTVPNEAVETSGGGQVVNGYSSWQLSIVLILLIRLSNLIRV